MTRPIRIGEEAAAEFAEAVRCYERERPGFGAQLFDAVQRVLRLIETQPGMGSKVQGLQFSTARRVKVRKFPYQIIYYVRRDEIAVVAVAHTRRRPGYWKSRR